MNILNKTDLYDYEHTINGVKYEGNMQVYNKTIRQITASITKDGNYIGNLTINKDVTTDNYNISISGKDLQQLINVADVINSIILEGQEVILNYQE